MKFVEALGHLLVPQALRLHGAGGVTGVLRWVAAGPAQTQDFEALTEPLKTGCSGHVVASCPEVGGSVSPRNLV